MKTEFEIERILRHAPTPEPPPQLAGKLRHQIELPREKNNRAASVFDSLRHRWFPALAYAILILGCVVVLAVQDSRQYALIRQNEELHKEIAIAQDKATKRQQEVEQAENAARQIEQLKSDASEADQLAARLDELKSQIAALTAQAKNLETQLAAIPETPRVIAPYDFFGAASPLNEAREKAASIACINNLKQIGLAIRIWESDHENMMPPNLNALFKELSVPRTLCCPADQATMNLVHPLDVPGTDRWAGWPLNGGSYEYLTPGMNADSLDLAKTVVIRCRIHGHKGMGDGAAFMADPAN